MSSSVGKMTFPIYGQKKNYVPNHQPAKFTMGGVENHPKCPLVSPSYVLTMILEARASEKRTACSTKPPGRLAWLWAIVMEHHYFS
jgi:hypothetical protein